MKTDNKNSQVSKAEDNNQNPDAKKNQGNFFHQVLLLVLSLAFNGWGLWQGGRKIRGIIFALLPIIAVILTFFWESPPFLYLAFLTGLLTGSFILLLPYYFYFIEIPLFLSPLLWLGIPIKLICLADSWLLGKKTKPVKFIWKSGLLFLGLFSSSLFIFHYKFLLFKIENFSHTCQLEVGDTAIFIKTNTLFAQSSFIQNNLKRGNLVLFSKDAKTRIGRIIGLPGEKIRINSDHQGIINFSVTRKGKTGMSKLKKYPDPCVFLIGDKYEQCTFYTETIGNRSYQVAYLDKSDTVGIVVNNNFKLNNSQYFLLPDIRSKNNLSFYFSGIKPELIADSDIIGIPLTILWSNHEKEGIRWYRLTSSID
ncbi:MAG: S26 family signal peptidase [Deltaproteobacteria bacterium]|jgi:signal peptidase I|nr:S26 family signal peptidase [Deltaproteobacteria bacterium]